MSTTTSPLPSAAVPPLTAATPDVVKHAAVCLRQAHRLAADMGLKGFVEGAAHELERRRGILLDVIADAIIAGRVVMMTLPPKRVRPAAKAAPAKPALKATAKKPAAKAPAKKPAAKAPAKKAAPPAKRKR